MAMICTVLRVTRLLATAEVDTEIIMDLIYSNINRKGINLPDRVVPMGSVDEEIVKPVDEGISKVPFDEITDDDSVGVDGDEKDDDDDDESRRSVELDGNGGGIGPRGSDDGKAEAAGSIDSSTEDKMLDGETPDD